jgi:DNA damage-binding protein 1
MKLERLGKTSQPSTLSYLDSGVVFVGSSFGDSQLIKLHNEPPNPEQASNYVEVVDTIPNLGPILDFCVMDLDRQGQGQVRDLCNSAGDVCDTWFYS